MPYAVRFNKSFKLQFVVLRIFRLFHILQFRIKSGKKTASGSKNELLLLHKKNVKSTDATGKEPCY